MGGTSGTARYACVVHRVRRLSWRRCRFGEEWLPPASRRLLRRRRAVAVTGGSGYRLRRSSMDGRRIGEFLPVVLRSGDSRCRGDQGGGAVMRRRAGTAVTSGVFDHPEARVGRAWCCDRRVLRHERRSRTCRSEARSSIASRVRRRLGEASAPSHPQAQARCYEAGTLSWATTRSGVTSRLPEVEKRYGVGQPGSGGDNAGDEIGRDRDRRHVETMRRTPGG